MARYHYTRENKNGVVLYLESEPAEDAMDEFDDEIAVGFSGNGYLRFWTRCRRAAEALPNGLKYAAEAFISTHGNEVNDEEHGIGSVTYWTIEVERRTEYKENEWLPCDESGRIDDGYGNEPDAIVAYFSSLEGSREERAFELAKNEYLAWLEHRTDRYTTVYGYMD